MSCVPNYEDTTRKLVYTGVVVWVMWLQAEIQSQDQDKSFMNP